MQSATYYRKQAARAIRLRDGLTTPDVVELLTRLARDYEDIAIDLDRGAIAIVHPERLPQRHHTD